MKFILKIVRNAVCEIDHVIQFNCIELVIQFLVNKDKKENLMSRVKESKSITEPY